MVDVIKCVDMAGQFPRPRGSDKTIHIAMSIKSDMGILFDVAGEIPAETHEFARVRLTRTRTGKFTEQFGDVAQSGQSIPFIREGPQVQILPSLLENLTGG